MSDYKLKYTGEEIDGLLDRANDCVSSSDLNDAILGIDVPEITIDNETSITSENAVSNKAITGLVQTIDRYTVPTVTEGTPAILSLDLALPAYENDKIINLSAKNLPITISWNHQTSGYTGNFVDICFGKGIFIAISGSYIYTSADGETWTLQNSGITTSLNKITFGNGKFVAVGTSGTIISSEDAINWTISENIANVQLRAVCWGNNEFMAVGNSMYVYTSPNGINWTLKRSNGTRDFYSVAYGKGLYVMTTGQVATGVKEIYWTADGTNFSSVQKEGSFSDVYFFNDEFIVRGNDDVCYFSSNGTDWAQHQGCASGLCMTYGNGIYMTVGYYHSTSVSNDCRQWTHIRNNSFSGTLYAVAYGNGKFIAVGQGGIIATCSADKPIYAEPMLNINNLGNRKINGTIEGGNVYTLIYKDNQWDIYNPADTVFKKQEIIFGETMFNHKKKYSCFMVGLLKGVADFKILMPNTECVLYTQEEGKDIKVVTTDTTISIYNYTDNTENIIYRIID